MGGPGMRGARPGVWRARSTGRQSLAVRQCPPQYSSTRQPAARPPTHPPSPPAAAAAATTQWKVGASPAPLHPAPTAPRPTARVPPASESTVHRRAGAWASHRLSADCLVGGLVQSDWRTSPTSPNPSPLCLKLVCCAHLSCAATATALLMASAGHASLRAAARATVSAKDGRAACCPCALPLHAAPASAWPPDSG